MMRTTQNETMQTTSTKQEKQLPLPPIQKQPKIPLEKKVPTEQQSKKIKGISHLQETFNKLGIDLTTLNQLLPGNCVISCEQKPRGPNEMNEDEMNNFFNSHGIPLDSIKAFLPEQCEIRCPKASAEQQVSSKMKGLGFQEDEKLNKRKQVITVVPSSRINRKKLASLETQHEAEMKKREVETTETERLGQMKSRKLFIVAFGKGALISLGQISRDPQLANQVKLLVNLGPGTGRSAKSSAPLIKLYKTMDVSYLNVIIYFFALNK
jgi:hypothetical protein